MKPLTYYMRRYWKLYLFGLIAMLISICLDMMAPQITKHIINDVIIGGRMELLMKLLPLIQELSGQQDSNARQLLYALRPYLKPERQEKVERALQLARLFHLGKKFLAGWEG